jgi:hypothetical protein
MIDYRLVEDALIKVGTRDFELFGQAFYSSIQDRTYVPLGGTHDGGADGYMDLFEDEVKSNFIQITKEKGTSSKIRKTVKRLREYGRDPKFLTLITSQIEKDIDKLEKRLSEDLGLTVRVRDGSFIKNNINASDAIRQAFYSYLEPSIEYLYRPGEVGESSAPIDGVDRSLAVFLRQEVTSRRGQSNMTQSLTDSLIIWALRDTDPDQDRLMSEDQILLKILETLPSAKTFVKGSLGARLAALGKKAAGEGRQIRVYNQNPKQYCLPYETRLSLAAQNADDEILRLQASAKIEERSIALNWELAEKWGARICELCHLVLEKCFYEQGVNIAQFVEGGSPTENDPELNISAEITAVLEGEGLEGEELQEMRLHVAQVLRGTFYRATDAERTYLSRLARTYVLMLMVRNEPKVVEYFSSMSSKFDLYIGTDMLIRALSEQHVDKKDRYTENLFQILREAGSRLILTSKAVEEVGSHLRRQILEYEYHYWEGDRFVRVEDVRLIDRLLIRSYFYAKLAPVPGQKKPRSFRDYVNQFADYGAIRAQKGWDDLSAFLCAKFDLVFEDEGEMMRGVDKDELAELTDQIHVEKNREDQVKKDKVLAYNDALHVLRVYGRRQENGETNPKSPFGYKTWWLTQDRKVRKASASAMEKRRGARFMMRPEFLLHYVGLNPALEDVRKSFEQIMPSVFGIHLGGHIDAGLYKKIIKNAVDISEKDEARAFAMIRSDTQALQSDFGRVCEELD